MVESVSDFPFRKLSYYKYLTLEVLMYVDIQEAYNFLFSVNKEGKSFLERNFITVRNGFVNDGLVTCYVHDTFYDFVQLEKQYFKLLTRNIGNRVLTLDVEAYDF